VAAAIGGLIVILFLMGLGYLLGHAKGKTEGRELGIREEASRWKAKGEWQVKKGERHE
jgi:hypothetical protein